MIDTATAIRPAALPLVTPREPSSEEKFHALLAECERPLYGYLVNLVHDRDLAQDCFQDTFLRAHEALQRGQTVTRPWLFRVAHNRAIDEFRRLRRARPDSAALEETPVTFETDGALEVRRVMALLDPLDREVLELFVVHGYKTEEIGRIMGVSGVAVRQRLYRAREKFRRLYGAAA
jgi:RNA polymerase sigma-70 factor (ECF subfamily)